MRPTCSLQTVTLLNRCFSSWVGITGLCKSSFSSATVFFPRTPLGRRFLRHRLSCEHFWLCNRTLISAAASVGEGTSVVGEDLRNSPTAKEGCGLPENRVAVKDGDSFLASSGVTWRSLGLSQELDDALQRAQLYHPSAVQAVAIPSILRSGDVVIAAETGSGKTHAYLAPLFHKLHLQNQSTVDTTGQAVGKTAQQYRDFALVLCPNAILCDQVAYMASGLCDACGVPLLEVAVVCGGEGWPTTQPDVVVATPAALRNNLFAFDPWRRRKTAFVRDVKHVVFDEADMLLSGGFEKQVLHLLDMFRLEEKQLSKSEGKAANDFLDLQPWTSFRSAEQDLEDKLAIEGQEESSWTDGDEEMRDGAIIQDKLLEPKRKQDWLRSRKSYKRSKQYIFVAATLPENGKRAPATFLKWRFPEAQWVNGLLLHCHSPRLQQRWVEVNASTQVETLLTVISEQGTCGPEFTMKRTMVFSNSVKSVEDISGILRKAGIECLCYHRGISSEECSKTLRIFQQKGGVLVCTDSASRGLDIPTVNHVIQAEFAKTAIDFLHRVGRTARAGHHGLVTSLYTKEDILLVEAVRQAASSCQPVDGAFSRNRSFRKKHRKLAVSFNNVH